MPAIPSPTIVNTTVDELCKHAPFDQMDVPLLRALAGRLRLRYFAKGATIFSPAEGVVNGLLIVQRGAVSGIDGADTVGELTLTEGEMFPLGAVISRRTTVLTFTAATDVFCYEMSLAVFQEVMDASPPFRQFATRRLAHLLDQSRRNTQAHFGAALAETQTLASPLKSLLRRTLVAVAPSTPIAEVLGLMRQKRIGSVVVVVDQDSAPLGIFTERDVLDRVAVPRIDQLLPVSAVMTSSPFSLPAHASLFEAARAMAERRFRHVLVTEEGRLAGVVSEHDLFARQQLSLGSMAKSIDRADDVAALVLASADVRHMANALLAQGVDAGHLTQFVTTMNDAVAGRALVLARRQCPPPDVAWCWMGLGSEGRMEQTLATDQDNAIIFSAGADHIGTTKARLLAFAAVANHILDEVGFPLCRGDIMAKNPQWCLSEVEWRDTFGHWLRAINPQALLNAAIFFDLRALHGEASLVDNLKSWLAGAVVTQPIFLRQMAANALQVTPPIGVLRDFVDADADHPGTIDLKIYAARPFVDAARIFALAHQVYATNTADRLRQVAPKIRMGDDEVNAYIDGFHFVQLLRLRHQHAPTGSVDHAAWNPNRLRLDSLNGLDRRILKEVLHQARKLQARLEMDYRL